MKFEPGYTPTVHDLDKLKMVVFVQGKIQYILLTSIKYNRLVKVEIRIGVNTYRIQLGQIHVHGKAQSTYKYTI